MENPNSAPPAYDDEIDLWELWETIWSGRWLIIIITSIFTLSGAVSALLAQEWFKADVVIAPTDKNSAVGGALAQFGGLASLAGISIPGVAEGEPVAVLKSKDFAGTFIADLKLMPVLLEGLEPSSEEPDIRDAVRVFNTVVRSVSEDKKTGLITLSIRWKDPDIAAFWANELVKRLNNQLRTQAEEEAERNVVFLQREIAATSVVSLQQSMGRVLEGEMQKLMLARGNEQFAFKVIDRATPPKVRVSPNRKLTTLIAMLAGVFLGLLVVFLRKAVVNRYKR